MRMGPRYRRGSRAWRHELVNGGGAAPALAAERHYLQFNGTSDYAVADAVFGGISGDYTIAIKVAGRNTSNGTSTQTYYASGGPGTSPANQQRYDTCYCTHAGDPTTVFSGVTDGMTYGGISFAGKPADTNPRVFSVGRDTSARVRIIKPSGVESTSDSVVSITTPDHIAIGGRVDNALSPIANRYGAVSFISLVLASVAIPDAELTAWLNGTDATDHITGIDHYWVASDIDGASIPARVGTVALALTGPTSSDLVAWSP